MVKRFKRVVVAGLASSMMMSSAMGGVPNSVLAEGTDGGSGFVENEGTDSPDQNNESNSGEQSEKGGNKQPANEGEEKEKSSL